jgi:hypothetical protein
MNNLHYLKAYHQYSFLSLGSESEKEKAVHMVMHTCDLTTQEAKAGG